MKNDKQKLWAFWYSPSHHDACVQLGVFLSFANIRGVIQEYSILDCPHNPNLEYTQRVSNGDAVYLGIGVIDQYEDL